MRTSKDCLFRACCSKGVRHHHFDLAETPGQSRGNGKLYNRKKRKVSRYVFIGGCRMGDAGSELTICGYPKGLIRTYLAFTAWSYIGSRDKQTNSY